MGFSLNLKLVLLISGFVCSFQVSAAIINVTRRFEADGTTPDADAFSNPSADCATAGCRSRSASSSVDTHAVCDSSDCCMCRCLIDYSTYVVHERRCVENQAINTLSWANARYTIAPSRKPLGVLDLVGQDRGNTKFISRTRINCNRTLTVGKWQYLTNGVWKDGQNNIFSCKYKVVGGWLKELTFLKWTGTLDPKYAGIIIRLAFKCGTQNLGSLLAKVNGTLTIDTSITPPATTILVPTTGSTSAPTSLIPTSAPTSIPILAPATGPILVPTTTSQADVGDKGKRLNDNSTNKKTTGIAMGVVGGILALVGAVCILGVWYRRRKTQRSSSQPYDDKDNESTTKMQIYEDPVYAALPDNERCTAGDFDNPAYEQCDKERLKRRSKMDPLPPVPGQITKADPSSSTYQSLVSTTRLSTGPPVSYNQKISSPALDYENPVEPKPPITAKPSIDVNYDNPPDVSPSYGNPMKKDISPVAGDRDNPMTPSDNDRVSDKQDFDTPSVSIIPENTTETRTPEGTMDPIYHVLEQSMS